MSQETFVLAHISDLHLSVEGSRSTIRRTRRLLEHMLRGDIDHVAVTGDIVADASPKELEVARNIFKSYGLLDHRKLSVVLGNHDVFGGVYNAHDIFSFPKRCKGTNYKEKLKRFCEAFSETFDRTLAPNQHSWFPFVKLLGDIVMYGVNSVADYSRVRNPFGSNGAVSDEEFKHLKSFLQAELFLNKTKLLLIHHHFSKIRTSENGTISNIWNAIEKRTMKLHGKKRLFNLFAATDVRVVLHGHIHENSEYERNGTRFINTGGSVIGSDPDTLYYKTLRVSAEKIESKLHVVPLNHKTPLISFSVPRLQESSLTPMPGASAA